MNYSNIFNFDFGRITNVYYGCKIIKFNPNFMPKCFLNSIISNCHPKIHKARNIMDNVICFLFYLNRHKINAN